MSGLWVGWQGCDEFHPVLSYVKALLLLPGVDEDQGEPAGLCSCSRIQDCKQGQFYTVRVHGSTLSPA